VEGLFRDGPDQGHVVKTKKTQKNRQITKSGRNSNARRFYKLTLDTVESIVKGRSKNTTTQRTTTENAQNASLARSLTILLLAVRGGAAEV
tara:strand:- start:228 stop:500 length:273 start_codon:yes stop_codon:yes gene_type:complete